MTKILVFESEPSFAWELRNELGRLGCTVQIVDDGNAGLQMAAADKPDLILLSIELPRMNGFSVCNKLKKDPNLKEVPLLIMSSESSEETFEQHRKLKTRAEDYVRKPIAFGELVVHIRRLIPIAAAIEPEAILIDEPLLFDEEVEDLAAGNVAADAGRDAGRKPAAENEIDDFLGGAFDRLMADEEPKAPEPVPTRPRAPSLLPDPPTIPAPPPPGPAAASPVIVAPLPLPPPPPPLRPASIPPPPAMRPASVPPPPAPPPKVAASVAPPRPTAAAGPVTARSAPPPSSLAVDEIAAPTVPGTDVSSIEQLRIELARSREDVAHLQASLGAKAHAPQEDIEEAVRLRHEVEELRSKLAIANAGTRAGSSREFLELRETLSKNDKEIASLRDQLALKEKEAGELRESLSLLERDKAELADRLTEQERTSDELSAKLERLKEERYVFGSRAESLESAVAKLEAKLAAQEVDAAAQAAAHAEELEAERQAKQAVQLAAEQALAATKDLEARLAADAARHAEEIEQLRTEHAQKIESLTASHAAEVKSLREASAQEVDAAHESEIATIRQEHSSEIETVRADNLRAIEELKVQHAAEIAEAARITNERLASRERELAEEWARATADLETKREAARAEAEQSIAERIRAEATAQFEAKLHLVADAHRTELAQFREERDRAIDELEASKRSAVQELDRYVIGLGADLQDTRQKLEETEQQYASLKSSVASLEDDLSKQRAQVAHLEAELRTAIADKERTVAEAIANASRVARVHARWEQDRVSIEHAREALLQAAMRLREIEERATEDE